MHLSTERHPFGQLAVHGCDYERLNRDMLSIPLTFSAVKQPLMLFYAFRQDQFIQTLDLHKLLRHLRQRLFIANGLNAFN